MLIDDLNEIQHRRGYLPPEEIAEYSDRTNTPLHRIQAVASFYPHFRLSPPPTHELLVCTDLACHLRNGTALLEQIERLAGPETHVRPCSCLGLCDAAPAVWLDEEPIGHAEPEALAARLGGAVAPDHAVTSSSQAPGAALALDPYSGRPVYAAWQRVRGGELPPAAAIAVLKEAGLRGMGGAGFPTGAKWELVRGTQSTIKYVICNADESEPGTFKDRQILMSAPHLVLEGMLIAAAVVGAREAVLYLRHEYPGPRVSFLTELERASEAGILEGAATVRIFDSPGGYICGEETALLEALEGKRAEPRNKPPFPGTHGLWGRPTVINNVETFALASAILVRGAEWYQSQGRNGGVGPKLLGLSGDICKPGVYEVPLGITIRQFIDEYGGGMLPGQELLAISPGGASSGFLPASMADTPLEFRALQQAGTMLGSGAVVAIGGGRCMLDLALNLVRFFKNESCGKCVPCRVGTEKLVAILEGWRSGKGSDSDLEVLGDLAPAMADASICGLGQIAPAPVISALKYWPDELREHYRRGRCAAGVCPTTTG